MVLRFTMSRWAPYTCGSQLARPSSSEASKGEGGLTRSVGRGVLRGEVSARTQVREGRFREEARLCAKAYSSQPADSSGSPLPPRSPVTLPDEPRAVELLS